MRRKKLILLFLFLVLATAISMGLSLVKKYNAGIYKKIDFEEYGFQISYPKHYNEVIKEKVNIEKATENLMMYVTNSDEPNPELVPTFVTELLDAQSTKNGISMHIEAIKKEKTPKTIEQLCKDYCIMYQVFHEDLKIIAEEHEEISVNDMKIGKIKIYIEKREMLNDNLMFVAYLIPLEDREITISFGGTVTIMENNKNEIAKIINTLKVKELPTKTIWSGDPIK